MLTLHFNIFICFFNFFKMFFDLLPCFFFFVHRILRNPGEYMQAFCDAATEIANSINPKYLKQGEQVLVGFKDIFAPYRLTPRDLLSEFIGSMVCVEGIVTKCNIF